MTKTTFLYKRRNCKNFATIIVIFAILTFATILSAEETNEKNKPNDNESIEEKRLRAQKLYKDGNYKESLDLYQQVLQTAYLEIGYYKGREYLDDFDKFFENCVKLNQYDTAETMIKKLSSQKLKIHDPRDKCSMLQRLAQAYLSIPHWGNIIDDKFTRADFRNTGRRVTCFERDRVFALRLMLRAEKALSQAKDALNDDWDDLYFAISGVILRGRENDQAWKLTSLTNLEELPEMTDQVYFHTRHYAPVAKNGKPIFYKNPKSWETAKNDGELFRYYLELARKYQEKKFYVDYRWAEFLHSQFGVHTMRDFFGYYYRRGNSTNSETKNDKDKKQGILSLHLLENNETTAKLATGIKRFKLPDEFNYIKTLKNIKPTDSDNYNYKKSLSLLANIYQNRRQFGESAKFIRLHIAQIEKEKKYSENLKNQLHQIEGNIGRFDGTQKLPATNPKLQKSKAQLGFVFRNAKKANFTIKRIKVNKLFLDIKAYLQNLGKTKSGINWQKTNFEQVGRLLVFENDGKKYLGKTIKKFSQKLTPNDDHWDKRIFIDLPILPAGAYFITAKIPSGNESHVVTWLTDTAIVQKKIDNGTMFLFADAESGNFLKNLPVELFGYHQEYLHNQSDKNGRVSNYRYKIHTKKFNKKTNNYGAITLSGNDFDNNYNFAIKVKGKKKQKRFGYYGFQRIWHNPKHENTYRQRKAFIITDRPVYRPNQEVKIKAWLREASYDLEDVSNFANSTVQVEIRSPKNEKVFEQQITADEFGVIEFFYKLPDEATLGNYNIRIYNQNGISSYQNFRVEEYKKPEFEVAIEAPKKPIKLGEKFTAKIKAKYYFGAPVTEGKVKYSVKRSEIDERWFPSMPWDWLYGRGYWWFFGEYLWHPRWNFWGCKLPHFYWYNYRQEPPELILENEARLNAKGEVEVEINSKIAKEIYGDRDHKYEISAEITDKSRRTIYGSGIVKAMRKAIFLNAWPERGFYKAGESGKLKAFFRNADGRPLACKGKFKLFKIAFEGEKLSEDLVHEKKVEFGDDGFAEITVKFPEIGQFRATFFAQKNGEKVESAVLLNVRGEADPENLDNNYKFNDLEIVVDKKEYKPGEQAEVLINTKAKNSNVLLFVKPEQGIYPKPKLIKIRGKSKLVKIPIENRDKPNFFIEAVTVRNGKVFSEMRQIFVPPDKRILQVEAKPEKAELKPNQNAKVQLKITDNNGNPYAGQLVVTVYDKSLEYISGGSNIPEIKEFFWKWTRHHNQSQQNNLQIYFQNLYPKNGIQLNPIGIFGGTIADDSMVLNNNSQAVPEMVTMDSVSSVGFSGGKNLLRSKRAGDPQAMFAKISKENVLSKENVPSRNNMEKADLFSEAEDKREQYQNLGEEQSLVQPIVRKNFADLVFWAGEIKTDADGRAEIEFPMPENLTTWKVRAWAMGKGTRVGQAETELITSKDFLVRLQAPRFFVQNDEVVISANVHNYLKEKKTAEVSLEIEGNSLFAKNKKNLTQSVQIKPNGEVRIDWRVKVINEGNALLRVKGLTDEESDAMQLELPALIHGIEKTDSWSGFIGKDAVSGKVKFSVPAERKPEASKLEVRYSPSVALAMVDALPYLIDYPYGCTEQTLNRFVPAVITRSILEQTGVDLAKIKNKKTNLNAQQIGDKNLPAKKIQKYFDNPVYDDEELDKIVKIGVKRLKAMQNVDGGWGWFYGGGESSYPHTTATVVRGLLTAKKFGKKKYRRMLSGGIDWLRNYQKAELQKLENYERWSADFKSKKVTEEDRQKYEPMKGSVDNIDALVFYTLSEAKRGKENASVEMVERLYEQRTDLSIYSKCLLGLGLHNIDEISKRDMVIRNIRQFLKQDSENQTAYLELGNSGYWWRWYGGEVEANAHFLKLLSAVEPNSATSQGLAKYLVNNRKNGYYWNSTRDTAYCIEALADYVQNSDEDEVDMDVDIFVDGSKKKQVKVNRENMFDFDNKFSMSGAELTSGDHELKFVKKGDGNLYFNAYLTYFSLEKFIEKSGLEVKVERRFYKLNKKEGGSLDVTSRGTAREIATESYEREKLASGTELKSGDLLEIELILESKNYYEYLVVEDMKAAGLEALKVRSGFTDWQQGFRAYQEFRDSKVVFFIRELPRGRHSLTYRMRAEIPGKFHALPTKISGMYAPELRGNSDEMVIRVED